MAPRTEEVAQVPLSVFSSGLALTWLFADFLSSRVTRTPRPGSWGLAMGLSPE